jgi:CubicO group peptidase (beta-lactamase class C family)
MEYPMRTGIRIDAPISWRLAAALALVGPATAQDAGQLSADKRARIEAAIEAAMSRWQIPGLSIAVVKGDGVPWKEGFGLADLENDVPARPGTVYRIASVTKSLSAVCAMRLAERGELDVDAPIQRYVPSFPEKPWPLTAVQLLGHLAGVRNYRQDDFGGLPDNTLRYGSSTEALGIFAVDPLIHEPGTSYAYTTFGYTLLGAAMEGASGSSFVDTLRENVLEPAKMHHTRADSLYDVIPGRARGYTRLGVGERFAGRPLTGPPRNCDLMDSSYKIPGGGLVSTVEDLAAFVIALQSGVLVKRETFERMATRQRTRDGKETPYGLGWYVDGIEGWSGVVWHGGVQKGVTSTLVLRPKDRCAVAILTNLEGGLMLGLENLACRILDVVLE